MRKDDVQALGCLVQSFGLRETFDSEVTQGCCGRCSSLWISSKSFELLVAFGGGVTQERGAGSVESFSYVCEPCARFSMMCLAGD